MQVKDLIKELQKMPPNAEVKHVWDGAARTDIDMVYLAQSGFVITIESDMVVYHDEDRPINAPSSDKEAFYRPMKTY